MGEPSSPRLTLQELVGAAERLRRRGDAPQGISWMPLVEEARDRIARDPFEALPLQGFMVEDRGKRRQVASPTMSDRVIEEALLPRLQRAFEPHFLPCVHGSRPGRSTFSAAAEAARALASGLHQVALLDIADFFPSIDRDRLRTGLSAHLSAPLLEVVMALVAAPVAIGGDLQRSERGLPIGRPISPLLANFYLLDVDRSISARFGSYCRYVDDIFLAAATAVELRAVEDTAVAALSRLGLKIAEDKTQRIAFDGAPFLYLGHLISERGIYERVGTERLDRIVKRSPPSLRAEHAPLPEALARQPNRRSQTLYVTEPGLYLSVQRGLIVLRRGHETVREIAAHRVDRILVLAGVSMSSGFLSACIAEQRPVLFFVSKGRAYGSLVAGGMPNPLRLRAQYELLCLHSRRLALATAVVRAKMEAMLRRLTSVTEAAELRQRIGELSLRTAQADSTATLRGLEGAATRFYYEGLALRIRKPGFSFNGRTRRPPRDAINSLLSFAYSLVFGEMQTALLADGLDPHAGIFHDLRADHPALASDLVEPYRVLVADSFVLTLVNNGRVTPEDFEEQQGGAVYLRSEGRRTVLRNYEAFMDSRAGGSRGTTTPRRLIHAGARAMLRVVLGETTDLELPLTQPTDEDSEP